MSKSSPLHRCVTQLSVPVTTLGASPTIARITILRQFLFLSKYGPASLRRRFVELIPSKNVKAMIDLTDTMERSSKKILEKRKKALESGEDVLSDKSADILSSLSEFAYA